MFYLNLKMSLFISILFFSQKIEALEQDFNENSALFYWDISVLSISYSDLPSSDKFVFLDSFSETIVTSFQKWEKSCSKLIFRIQKESERSKKSWHIRIQWLEHWPYATHFLAVTERLALRNGELKQVVVFLNSERSWCLNKEEFCSNQEKKALLKYVMTHEWGHSLGFSHTLNRNSLMRVGIRSAVQLKNPHLLKSERRAFCRLYPRETKNKILEFKIK